MGYDPDRRCLVLFLSSGDITEYDLKTNEVRNFKASGNVKTGYKRPAWIPERKMYFGGARVKDAKGKWRWLFYDLKKRAWLGLLEAGDSPVKGKATVFNSFGTAYDPQSKTILGLNNRTEIWACRLDLENGDVKVLAEMKPVRKK